ncbi:MAG: DUF6288 domain-containing protein [Planctomycetaceae bacterium]
MPRRRRAAWAVPALVVAILAASRCVPARAGQGSYPMGELGGRCSMVEGQGSVLRVEKAYPGLPLAAAGVAAGDLVDGVDGRPFGSGYMMPLKQLGFAIDDGCAGGGVRLTTRRDGKPREVTVKLPQTGRFSSTYPFDCPKSERIYAHALAAMTPHFAEAGGMPGGPVTNALGAMALMGDRSGKGLAAARPYVSRVASGNASSVGERSVWLLSYTGVMLCEHQMMQPDPMLETAIRNIADLLERGVPSHGRYGHHVNPDKGDEGLPYGGQGLNGTTTCALWFMTSAVRSGLDAKALKTSFPKALARVRQETNENGGVGYAWADDDQSCMRTGHTALAAHHLVSLPVLMGSDPSASLRWRAALATWPTRHVDDLLEAHAVSSMGITASTAGLAAYDRQQYQQVMQQWRWYFALAWQPDPANPSQHEIAYVGGPNNVGGDYYLNGHRELDAGFNSIMHATVGFIFAAAHERLSFYGGMAAVPGLSTSLLKRSATLRQAVAALNAHRYGEAARIAKPLADKASDSSSGSEPPEPGSDEEVAVVARNLFDHVDKLWLTPELERLRKAVEAGDLAQAFFGLKTYAAGVRGLDAYEEPAKELLAGLDNQEDKDAVKLGLRFHAMEKAARGGSRAAVENLEKFAAEHEGTFYGRRAREVLDGIAAGPDSLAGSMRFDNTATVGDLGAAVAIGDIPVREDLFKKDGPLDLDDIAGALAKLSDEAQAKRSEGQAGRKGTGKGTGKGRGRGDADGSASPAMRTPPRRTVDPKDAPRPFEGDDAPQAAGEGATDESPDGGAPAGQGPLSLDDIAPSGT